ncbi:hypothetical protein D3C73_1132170 [compost metagenome]
MQQYRGLAVLEFTTYEEQPDFTHAWFPVAEFDESRVSGSLALARSGEGAVLLRAGSDLEATKDGPSAGAELRQYGQKTSWIVRVCEAGDLASVESRFGALHVERTGDGTLVVADPEYGSVSFRADGTVEAEGRVITRGDYDVKGEATLLGA